MCIVLLRSSRRRRDLVHSAVRAGECYRLRNVQKVDRRRANGAVHQHNGHRRLSGRQRRPGGLQRPERQEVPRGHHFLWLRLRVGHSGRQHIRERVHEPHQLGHVERYAFAAGDRNATKCSCCSVISSHCSASLHFSRSRCAVLANSGSYRGTQFVATKQLRSLAARPASIDIPATGTAAAATDTSTATSNSASRRDYSYTTSAARANAPATGKRINERF